MPGYLMKGEIGGNMAEEKKEQWITYLAATTVVLAVLATLSTFFGQKNSTRAVISEIQSSNQWNYYQAKKIRSYLFEVQKDGLEIDLKMRGQTLPAESAKQLEERLGGFASKIKKWEEDMSKIQKQARTLETTRDNALTNSKNFGIAVVFLQMAILLSSVAALMKRQTLWIAGLIVGVGGAVYFVNGFFVFL
jgi:ABC-type multidrug transport system fused ATPase/permease subunit